MAANTVIGATIRVTADAKEAKAQLSELQQSIHQIANQQVMKFDTAELKNAVKGAQDLEKALKAALNVDTGKLNLSAFSRSLKQSKTDIISVGDQLKALGPQGAQAFSQVVNAIGSANTSTLQLNGHLSTLLTNLKKTAQWQISSTLIHGFVGKMQEAVYYAKDLNNSLNDIRQVTKMNTAEVAQFASAAQKAAADLSASTLSFVDASKIFFQQGDSMAVAMQKATITMKAANISFGSSTKEMSQYLTAIWNSYKVGADEMERYVDIMAALGAKTATSMEEISTAMKKVAATANNVGVSMEQMSSIIATSASVTRQSAEIVGTAWNTILSRIGGLKLGETLEDGVDLNKYSAALNKVGVQVLDASGNLRDMGTVIEELGNKWQTLSKSQQSALAQTIGGTRQYTQMMAFFDNFKTYEVDLKIAENSKGELQAQQDIWAESWEAASGRVKNAWQGLYSEMLDDSAFVKMTNVFADMINGITKVIDKMGGIVPVITMVAGAIVSKMGASGAVGKALASLTTNFDIITGKAANMQKITLEHAGKAAAQQATQYVGQGNEYMVAGQRDQARQSFVAAERSTMTAQLAQARINYQAHGRLNQEAQEQLTAWEEKAEINSQAKAQAMTENAEAQLKMQKAQENIKADTGAEHARMKAQLDQARYQEQQANARLAQTGLSDRDKYRAEQVLSRAQTEKAQAEASEAKYQSKQPTGEVAQNRMDNLKAAESMGVQQQVGLGVDKIMSARKAQAAAAESLIKAQHTGDAEKIKQAQAALKSATEQAVAEAQKTIQSAAKEYAKLEDEVNALTELEKKSNNFGKIDGQYSKDEAYEQFASQMNLGKVDRTASKKEQAEQMAAIKAKVKDKFNITEEDFSSEAGAQKAIGKAKATRQEGMQKAQQKKDIAAGALQEQGIDPKGYVEAAEAAGKTEVAVERVKQKQEELNNEIKKTSSQAPKLSDTLAQGLGGAMQAVGGLNMTLSGLSTAFDSNASAGQRLSGVLSALMGVMQAVNGVTAIAKALHEGEVVAKMKAAMASKLKIAANQAEEMSLMKLVAKTIASIAVDIAKAISSLGVVGAIIAVAAAMTALIVVLAMAMAGMFNLDAQMKALDKEMEELNKQEEKLIARQQDMQSTMSGVAAILADTTKTIDQQVDAINELTSAYGVQVTALDLMTGRYGQLQDELNRAMLAEQQEITAELEEIHVKQQENVAKQVAVTDKAAMGFFEKIQYAIESLIANIPNYFKILIDKLKIKALSIWADILDFIQDFPRRFKNFFKKMLNGLADLINSSWILDKLGIKAGYQKLDEDTRTEEEKAGYQTRQRIKELEADIKSIQETIQTTNKEILALHSAFGKLAKQTALTADEQAQWAELYEQHKDELEAAGFTLDADTGGLKIIASMNQDWGKLYSILEKNGARDFGGDGSYTAKLFGYLEKIDADSLANTETAIRQSQLMEQLYTSKTDGTGGADLLDALNTKNKKRSLKDVRTLLETIGASNIEDTNYIVNNLTKYGHWNTAATRYAAVSSIATSAQKTSDNKLFTPEEVRDALLDAVDNGTIDIDTLLYVRPSGIKIIADGENLTVEIDPTALAMATALALKAQSENTRTQIAEIQGIDKGATIDFGTYKSLWDTGYFESYDQLYDYASQSQETRALQLKRADQEALNAQISANSAIVEAGLEEMDQLRIKQKRYYDKLDELLLASGSEYLRSKADDKTENNEETYRQLVTEQTDLMNAVSAKSTFMSTYGVSTTWDTIKDDETKQEEWREAFLSTLTPEQKAMYSSMSTEKLMEEWTNNSQQFTSLWSTNSALLSELNQVMAEGVTIGNDFSNAQANVASATSELSAYEFQKRTTAIDNATTAVSAYTKALSSLGSLDFKDLNSLIQLDPDNALYNYNTMNTDEWTEYCYQQAVKYYDDLILLYQNDEAKVTELLQKKQALTDTYYATVGERAKKAAQAEVDAVETSLSKISTAMSELGDADLSTFAGIEKLKKALKDVGYTAEQVDNIIKNIGQDNGDEDVFSKEKAWAKTNAEIALLLKGQEIKTERSQDADYLIHANLVDETWLTAEGELREIPEKETGYKIQVETDGSGASIVDGDGKKLISLTQVDGVPNYWIQVDSTGTAVGLITGGDGDSPHFTTLTNGQGTFGITVPMPDGVGSGLLKNDGNGWTLTKIEKTEGTDSEYGVSVAVTESGERFLVNSSGKFIAQLKPLEGPAEGEEGGPTYEVAVSPTGAYAGLITTDGEGSPPKLTEFTGTYTLENGVTIGVTASGDAYYIGKDAHNKPVIQSIGKAADLDPSITVDINSNYDTGFTDDGQGGKTANVSDKTITVTVKYQDAQQEAQNLIGRQVEFFKNKDFGTLGGTNFGTGPNAQGSWYWDPHAVFEYLGDIQEKYGSNWMGYLTSPVQDINGDTNYYKFKMKGREVSSALLTQHGHVSRANQFLTDHSSVHNYSELTSDPYFSTMDQGMFGVYDSSGQWIPLSALTETDFNTMATEQSNPKQRTELLWLAKDLAYRDTDGPLAENHDLLQDYYDLYGTEDTAQLDAILSELFSEDSRNEIMDTWFMQSLIEQNEGDIYGAWYDFLEAFFDLGNTNEFLYDKDWLRGLSWDELGTVAQTDAWEPADTYAIQKYFDNNPIGIQITVNPEFAYQLDETQLNDSMNLFLSMMAEFMQAGFDPKQLFESEEGYNTFLDTLTPMLGNIFEETTSAYTETGDKIRAFAEAQPILAYIIQGLMKSMSDDQIIALADALGMPLLDTSKEAIEAFKALWEIASPSKLMMRMGKYIVEGLNQGLSKNKVDFTGLQASMVKGINEMVKKAKGAAVQMEDVWHDLGWNSDYYQLLGNKFVNTDIGEALDLDNLLNADTILRSSTQDALLIKYVNQKIAQYNEEHKDDEGFEAYEEVGSVGEIVKRRNTQGDFLSSGWAANNIFNNDQFNQWVNSQPSMSKEEYLRTLGIKIVKNQAGKFIVTDAEGKQLIDETFDDLDDAVDAAAMSDWMEGRAKEYLQGGFWNDSQMNAYQKVLYNQIIEATLKKLGVSSIDEYLEKGHSIDDFVSEMETVGKDKLSELNTEIDTTWANIKDKIKGTMQECDEYDESMAQKQLDRWKSIFSSISKLRKAAFSGDTDSFVNDLLDSTSREAWIAKWLEEGKTPDEIRGLLMGKASDTNYDYADFATSGYMGQKKTTYGKYINRAPDGTPLNTTGEQLRANYYNARYDSYLTQLHEGNTFDPNAYARAASVNEIMAGRIKAGQEFTDDDWIREYIQFTGEVFDEIDEARRAEILDLRSGASALMAQTDASGRQTTPGLVQQESPYGGTYYSWVGTDGKVMGKEDVYTWMASQFAEQDADIFDATEWSQKANAEMIAALTEWAEYQADFKAAIKSDTETQQTKLQTDQALVQKAMENGIDSLNEAERKQLDDIMKEGKYDTLAQANYGLAQQMDSLTDTMYALNAAMADGIMFAGVNAQGEREYIKSENIGETPFATEQEAIDAGTAWQGEHEGGTFTVEAVETEVDGKTEVHYVAKGHTRLTESEVLAQYRGSTPEDKAGAETVKAREKEEAIWASEAGFSDTAELEAYTRRLVDLGVIVEEDQHKQLEFAKGLARMEKGFKTAKDNLKTYMSELKNANTNTKAYTDTVKNLRSMYADLFDLDAWGADQLSETFLTSAENAKLLEKAMNGDNAAWNELQANAAKDIVLKYDADISGAQDKVNSFFDYIAGMDLSTLEVGAEIDDEGFNQQLNDMIMNSYESAQAMSDALSSMGVDAEIVEHVVTAKGEVRKYMTSGTIINGNGEPVDVEAYAEMRSDPSAQVFYTLEGAKYNGRGVTNSKKTSGSGGGGGGGGNKETKEHKKFDDEVDRYHVINSHLEQLKKHLTEIDKLKTRAYGQKHLDELTNEIGALKQQIDLQKQYLAEAQNYLTSDAAILANEGAIFGADGTVINYDSMLQAWIDQYNAAVDTYNNSEQEDADKDALEAAEDLYEDRKKWLSNYEDSLGKVADAENEILELQNKISTALLERITYKVKLVVDLNASDLKVLDYFIDKMKSILHMQDEMYNTMVDKSKEYEHNLAIYGEAIAELEKQHQIFLDTNGEDGINDSDYATQLQEYRDSITSTLSDIQKLRDSIKDVYGSTLKEANTEITKHINVMQLAANVANEYLDILGLMGHTIPYDELKQFYDLQYDSGLNTLKVEKEWIDTLEKELQYYQKKIDAGHQLTETEKKQWEDLLDQYKTAQEKILSDTKKTLEDLEKSFDAYTTQIMKDLSEVNVAGHNNIQDVSDAYATWNEQQALYLTTGKQLYEVAKLNRQIEDSINDASTQASKVRLAALQEEINKKAESGKLTEYQIQMYDLQYKMALALQELEEAQNNKSTVRLTRDENGNYGYQYTADEDSVNQAEQDYEDALENIRQLTTEHADQMAQAYINARIEMEQRLSELKRSEYESDEEYYHARNEIIAKYTTLMDYYADQYEQTSQDLATNLGYIGEHYGLSAADTSDALKEALNEDIQAMIDNQDEYTEALNEALDEMDAAWDDYTEKINEVSDVTGINYDSMTASIEKYNNMMDDSVKKATEVIVSLDDTLNNIHKTTEEWDKHNEAINTVINNYEKLIQKLGQTLQALQNLSAGYTAANTSYTTTSPSYSGGDSGGSGSGSGGSGSGGNGNDSSSGKHWKFTYHGSTKTGYSSKSSAESAINSLAAADRNSRITNDMGRSVQDYWYNQIASWSSAAKSSLTQYLRGGIADYTGPAWLDGTPQKPELVLNSGDTETMLAAVKLVHALSPTILSLLTNNALGMLASDISAGNVNSGPQDLQQNVQITAEFPNATDHNEIEMAFNDLINQTAQYINRK